MAATQERDFYDEARLLIRNVKTATLATAEAGIPHAALVTVAFMELTPILLLSTLAVHTRQLIANPTCALLLVGSPVGAGPPGAGPPAAGPPAAGPPGGDSNPQTLPRLCLTGTAAETANPQARQVFLARHPYAELYADFADFAFWQVTVTDSYYIGGFGVARKLDVAKLSTPQ